MLAAGAGWVGCLCVFVCVYVCVCVSSRLSIFPFLMPHLLGDDWT